MPGTKLILPKDTVVPNHIALILDGNGRWARSRGMQVTKGHEHGAVALRNVLDAARATGVHTLTIWGFSTENWSRPPKEVGKIMKLVTKAVEDELENAHKEQIKFTHIGRKDRLPAPLLKAIKKTEEETKDYSKFYLNLAFDYGGRDEILRAVRKIVTDKIPPNKIDEKLFASYLDTADQPYPYPDLFLRTSGEQRTSGYLPWQMTYTEFYFIEDHLPDVTPEHLRKAILDYSCRRRRYGGKDKVKHFRFKPKLLANLEMNWWRLGNIPERQKFSEFVMQYLAEQYGLSKTLAKQAGYHFVKALVYGDTKDWKKAKAPMKKFYKIVKDHLKLAFEPEIVASLRVKLWQEMDGKENAKESAGVEETAKRLHAEHYRISTLQAAKPAHLRVLAEIERNKARNGLGEQHWQKAEEYLNRYYQALKDRIA